MEKTFPKDIPSVNKVMLQLKNAINIHQTYLKKSFKRKSRSFVKMLKMAILINQKMSY